MITAKHGITNNLTNPVIVSSQYFLDCAALSGCTSFYSRSEMTDFARRTNIPLTGSYPGGETGVRGKCLVSQLSSVQQQMNLPRIVDYDYVPSIDKYYEDEVMKGPVLTRMYIPT